MEGPPFSMRNNEFESHIWFQKWYINALKQLYESVLKALISSTFKVLVFILPLEISDWVGIRIIKYF